MIEGIATLQGVLDRYPLPLKNTDYSKMFSELFAVFDALIADDSYYSAVMRRFSSYLKTGIFFDSAGQQSLFELVKKRLVTPEEAMDCTMHPEDLKRMLDQRKG